MRTKGQGKIIITSTPTGSNNFYDLYKMEKKLKIQNYSKDLMSAVFWGWDMITADEMDDVYLFQLKNRENPKLRVYITLGRELQVSDLENNLYQMYQCYIHDDGDWHETFWFDINTLNYKSFWDTIEKLVDKHHPLYPF